MATPSNPRADVAQGNSFLNQNEFEALGVDTRLLRALAEIGYHSPTPIQAKAIGPLLDGRDLFGIAQTGTGKTAAFGLPLLQRLYQSSDRAAPRQPRSLILAPTRELALQIHEELERFGRYTGLVSAVIFGGVGQNPQVKALARRLDVLVATPGRLLDLCGQRLVDLSAVTVLVLDEADRLLDMGFIRDVKRIVAQTPTSRQSLLFSATMPKAVSALARDMLDRPERVDVSPKEVTVRAIEQRVVMVDNADKRRVLETLLPRRCGVACDRIHANQTWRQSGRASAGGSGNRRGRHSRKQVAERAPARVGELQERRNVGAGGNRHRGPRHRHRRRITRRQSRVAA